MPNCLQLCSLARCATKQKYSHFVAVAILCSNKTTCPIQLTMKFCDCLPNWVVECVSNKDVREIRLRNNSAVKVNIGGVWKYCSNEGLTSLCSGARALDVSCDEIVNIACNNSIYAYEHMLSKGYFTLEGGVRFGVCGEYSPAGQVFQKYTSICIRIPHYIHCATQEMLAVVQSGNTIIAGLPAVGKTTLLRDIAAKLANNHNVVVIDERGELDACGELSNCDVLKWTSKQNAFEMILRSMAPNFVICDELSSEDFVWIERAICSGVNIVATIHAPSLLQKAANLPILSSFERAIICQSVGQYKLIDNLSQMQQI